MTPILLGVIRLRVGSTIERRGLGFGVAVWSGI